MMNVDKSKLVLRNATIDKITDTALETKQIGYYQDSWNRFKKSRASLVAFYIICVMLFFVILGPYMRGYDLNKTNSIEAERLGYLTPKIPLVENLGIFDGTKTISRGKQFLVEMATNEFGEGTILEGMPQELIDNPDHPDYADVHTLEVTVDMYRYTNYINSYMPENYFSLLESNENSGRQVNPLSEVTRTLTLEEFNAALERNIVIDILKILETPNLENPDEPYLQYEVRIDQFKASLGASDPSDVYFWFGTTSQGEDLFTEIWLGARISILMALSVTAINAVVGLIIGAFAGYHGGVLDLMLDRLVEILSAIPLLSLLILLTMRYGSGLWVIVVAFTVTGWIGFYRTGRMQFYRFKNREYVFAARTLGATDNRIMFKHIFPNTLGLIVTGLALSIPAFVFTEASYAFLGIIEYSNATSVGMLIEQGQQVMQHHPHLLMFPSFYIAILMIAFNLFGNGLRDAFNPSLRGVE